MDQPPEPSEPRSTFQVIVFLSAISALSTTIGSCVQQWRYRNGHNEIRNDIEKATQRIEQSNLKTEQKIDELNRLVAKLKNQNGN